MTREKGPGESGFSHAARKVDLADRAPSTAANSKRQLICAACGKHVERKSRQQSYCCQRCRQRANYEKKVASGDFNAAPAPTTALPTDPHKNINGFSGLQGAKSRSRISVRAPLNLLGGFRWRDATHIAPKRWQAIVTAEIGVVTI
jgi:hypothetical protein